VLPLEGSIRDFEAGIRAAVQPWEASRPLLDRSAANELMYAENGYIGVALARAATVATLMALTRLWIPSGNAFNADTLRRTLPEAIRREHPEVRKALNEDASFKASLDALKRWRDKRVAHRELFAVDAESPGDRHAMQSDVDRVIDHSIGIVDALAAAFPSILLRDLRSERVAWRRDAEQFWANVFTSLDIAR